MYCSFDPISTYAGSAKYSTFVSHRFVRTKGLQRTSAQRYEKHHGGMSKQFLSRTYSIGQATVERWYQDFVKKRVKELLNRPCPPVYGIDEHFFTRKVGYVTTFCDLKNRKLFELVPAHSEKALTPFLSRLVDSSRVKVVVIDLSESYRKICRSFFPNALIVADRFHVIRLVNHYFLKAWKCLDPKGRKNRGLLSLMRRHETNLSQKQKERLQKYLSQHQVLKEIYAFKQKLCQLLSVRAKNKKALKPVIYEFYDMIERLKKTSLEPLQVLEKTLYRWREEIGTMCVFLASMPSPGPAPGPRIK